MVARNIVSTYGVENMLLHTVSELLLQYLRNWLA